jgi:hypothetical protein
LLKGAGWVFWDNIRRATFSRFGRRIILDRQASFDLLEIILVRITAARKTGRPRVVPPGGLQMALKPPLGRAIERAVCRLVPPPARFSPASEELPNDCRE